MAAGMGRSPRIFRQHESSGNRLCTRLPHAQALSGADDALCEHGGALCHERPVFDYGLAARAIMPRNRAEIDLNGGFHPYQTFVTTKLKTRPSMPKEVPWVVE